MSITEKINLAKSQIITFETLPPQIDYRLPYKRNADESNAFLEALPEKIKTTVFKEIQTAIEEYYGENGAAQYDCLF